MDAFVKSDKTLVEMLEFFRSDMKDDPEEDKLKRRGRRFGMGISGLKKSLSGIISGS